MKKYALILMLAFLLAPFNGSFASDLSNRLKGKILLQVESRGEAWYVEPKTGERCYMANGDEAYNIMRNLGVGITNKDLERIKADKNFAKKHSGKIFLQVEDKGQAYYIDFDGNEHYLKNGSEAYNIMRNLGLGITDKDLNKVTVSQKSIDKTSKSIIYPTDEGNQKVENNGNNNVAIADICKNIEGIQSYIPNGMTKDADENCIMPPTPTPTPTPTQLLRQLHKQIERACL